jgi:hypothetical protein
MPWPLSQAYNEAIQSPATNFADPDLRRGQAAANAFGIPTPLSGNFADVYQVRCPDGSRWAVKCFTRETPGLRERYAEISRHLRQARLRMTVDFDYLEQGIRVAGRWYPALKMEWVEGQTLNQFVSRVAHKPIALDALLLLWARMARHLRREGIAHCDLQHGNVLLVPEDGARSLALRLVDYDGMFVPALAGRPSGEAGHASYQHPRRLLEGTYSLEMDRFPVLLVATALAALRVKGHELWERYDNGDNLLFTQEDLEAPSKSRLFYELLKVDNQTVRVLTHTLIEATRQPLDQTPLLEAVLPELRSARVRTPAPIIETVYPVAVPVAAAVASPADESEFEQPARSSPTEREPARAAQSLAALLRVILVPALVALASVLLLCGAVTGIVYFATRGQPSKPTEQVTLAQAPPADERSAEGGGATPTVEEAPLGQELFTVGGHTGPVCGVVFSPDGTRIASTGAGRSQIGRVTPGEVKVWNAATGEEILTLRGHTDFIGAAIFSPDGKHIAIPGFNGVVKVCDAESGHETFTIKGRSVCFAPDSTHIATGDGDGIVKVWDALSGVFV